MLDENTVDPIDEKAAADPVAPPAEPDKQEEPTAIGPKSYNATVTISDNVFKSTDNKVIEGPKLSLLYTNAGGFSDFSNRTTDQKLHYTLQWATSVQRAPLNTVFEDGLEGLMERDADWAQNVEVDGVKLAAGKPNIAKSNKGNVLVGQQAISRVMALTQAGVVVKIPLWHSGIWVSIKAPQLSAWVELDRRISLEKVMAGRASRGLVFSNDSVFMLNHVVDFILNHVFDSTLQNWTTDSLRKTIKSPDISFLATGMALTVFPEGHPHSQPCTADAAKCQHVVEGIINLAKIMWVDRSALTESQRKHMLKRDKVHTADEIEHYQNQWLSAKEQTQVINDALKVVYRIPSLEDHIEAGTTWIGRLEEATEAAFGENLRGQQREEYLLNQTQATRIGLYVHWIDRFVITDDENEQVVEERETIEELSMSLSSSTEVAETVIRGAKKFINRRTISCIGIPNYQCPNCQAWHLTEEGPMKAIIPLDAVATFFTLLQSLLTSKLQRLE